ncbi:MAG: type II secretion system protein N [Geminicoccaceae bacterium]
MGDPVARWSASVWFLVCAGLGGVIGLEFSESLPLAPQVTAGPPGAPRPQFAPDPLTFKPPPRSAFDEIAARPLFSESRRPFVSPKPEAAADPPATDQRIELVGTLLTGKTRAALLQPEGQDARWLREGEQVAGWQVERIEADRIMLGDGKETKTLELRADLAGPAKPEKTSAERRRNRKTAHDEGQDQDDRQRSEDPGDSAPAPAVKTP